MVKSFILSEKKKLINTHDWINLGSFPKNATCIQATFLYNIGSFYKALHFLQFDILNME